MKNSSNYQDDASDDAMNWTITYGDGKKEKFTGSAHEAFEHAKSKSSMFAVEKDDE